VSNARLIIETNLFLIIISTMLHAPSSFGALGETAVPIVLRPHLRSDPTPAGILSHSPLVCPRTLKPSIRSPHYKEKHIADFLNMTVGEAAEFFADIPKLNTILKTLVEVGLDYVKLGQPAFELSGGEAQRVKLASELGRPSNGKTLYILD
jgi:hypothetical protein